MKILAVDVGIVVCGYCVCEIRGNDVSVIFEGEIKPAQKNSIPQKLNQIYEILEKQVSQHEVSAIVAEVLYSHYRHPATLGVLAQVQGVVALLSQQKKVEFYQYSPTRARKSMLGKGNADSTRVKRMAENINNRKFLSVHTADAYSLAIAFSHEHKFKSLLAQSKGSA